MDVRFYESDNPAVLGKAIKKAIKEDQNSKAKKKMREGLDYYDYKHEILNYVMYYIDADGIVRRDSTRSNIKIAHPYFTENVDQKVQYLLSNPVEIMTDDVSLQEYLKDYITEDFQVTLQEAVEGASKKGYEHVYAFINSLNRVDFKTADSLKIIEIYDDFNRLIALIRYYDTEILKDGKTVIITKAELWDTEKTWYFMSEGKGQEEPLILDPSEELNPRPHIIVEDTDGNQYERGFDRIPFFKLSNNKANRTDLEPIKSLIDDYDLMACALSNNLTDFDQPFFAVKGFDGSSYEELITNLKSRGAVGVGENGGLDLKTVNIPVEARQAKLEVDKEGIYKFGMAFDSSQVGDGNITNVVIKSRYSLLDLKCNKSEIRLRQLIRWMLELIIQDINEKNHKAYSARDLEINIVRDTMVNESDVINDEKTKAETQEILLKNIVMIAGRIDDENALKVICEILELDFEDAQKALEQQDYQTGLHEASEIDE